MHSSHNFIAFFGLIILLIGTDASAQPVTQPNLPLANIIEAEAESITEPRWRNHAYRDLAVSLVFAGQIDRGIALIQKIDNGDTQAMTIRAMGMAMAIHKDLDDTSYKNLFSKLDTAAKTIKDEGARDIAYTYIAMAQAFAGLDADATATTAAMKKPELKHKAYAETAEIQAERGDYAAALKSISAIKSKSFKNKALLTVSKIFITNKKYTEATNLAKMISNPTKKAEALQNVLNAQLGMPKKI